MPELDNLTEDEREIFESLAADPYQHADERKSVWALARALSEARGQLQAAMKLTPITSLAHFWEAENSGTLEERYEALKVAASDGARLHYMAQEQAKTAEAERNAALARAEESRQQFKAWHDAWRELDEACRDTGAGHKNNPEQNAAHIRGLLARAEAAEGSLALERMNSERLANLVSEIDADCQAAESDAAREALEAVEWQNNFCPWCHGIEPEWYDENLAGLPNELRSERGHAPDCLRQAGLAPSQEQEKETMETSWIAVDDTLPEVGKNVYTYNVNGGLCYHVLYLSDDGKWYDENYVENAEYDNPPTHWHKILMPEPPSQEAGGQPIVTTCAICEREHQIERIDGGEGWDDYYCPIANETFTHMRGAFTHSHGAGHEQEAER